MAPFVREALSSVGSFIDRNIAGGTLFPKKARKKKTLRWVKRWPSNNKNLLFCEMKNIGIILWGRTFPASKLPCVFQNNARNNAIVDDKCVFAGISDRICDVIVWRHQIEDYKAADQWNK